MRKSAKSNNNLKRFLSVALGGLLGMVLYGMGKYLIAGHIDIEHLITFFSIWLVGGAVGFLIAIKMLDL